MGNYIDFEFDGVKHGWKFNQPAYACFKSRVEGFEKEDYEAYSLYHLLYAGLKTNCIIKGVELDFTWEKCCEWADGLSPEQILNITEIFTTELNFTGIIKGDKKKAAKPKTVKKKIMK